MSDNDTSNHKRRKTRPRWATGPVGAADPTGRRASLLDALVHAQPSDRDRAASLREIKAIRHVGSRRRPRHG